MELVGTRILEEPEAMQSLEEPEGKQNLVEPED